jgi:selenocysteine lyase/cysteine desulfurase
MRNPAEYKLEAADVHQRFRMIEGRSGLHCAPLVHETLDTYPQGGVRFSLGTFNPHEDIDRIMEARGIIARYR